MRMYVVQSLKTILNSILRKIYSNDEERQNENAGLEPTSVE